MHYWINVKEDMPKERIRVLAADERLGYIIGDCFYGTCGPVTGTKWNKHFKDYQPISRPNEKCWRYTETEEPVHCNSIVTHWMHLPKGPRAINSIDLFLQ